MKILLITTWLCNAFDAAATVYLHSAYQFTEVNPVMAWLLRWPWAFALVKIGAMTGVVLWLWRSRESKLAYAASWVAAVAYCAVALYYIQLFVFLL